MTPKISIIIPNWNGIKFIAKCLDSIKQSTFSKYEILVVDNGSTDGSRELIQKKYRSVRLIHLPKNLGFARACNEGIHASKGKLIVLLNNDIEVDPQWLEELQTGMDRHPECGMGTSKMNFLDERDIIYNTGDLFKIWCTGGGRGHGERDQGQYETEEYVFGACAGAGVYRRELFDTVGDFDEDFFIFSEDVDFNLRAQYSGYKCIYLPKAKVYHIGTGTVGFHSNRHVFLFARNDFFVLLKNYSLWSFIRYFPKVFIHRFRMIQSTARAGQGFVLLKANLSFLYFFFGMLWKRWKLRRKAKFSVEHFQEVIQFE